MAYIPGRDDGRYSEQAEDEAPPQYTPVASSSSAVATANESAYATSASQHPGGGAASSSGAATTTTTKPSGSGTDEGGLQAHDIRELNPEAQKKVLQARDEQGASLADYALFDSSEPPPAQGYHHHNSAPGQYEYTLDDEGNMISHDPALATDPDKLAAFLRLHASAPPVVSVRVHGSHMEERTEIVHHHHQHGGSSHHHHHHDSSSLRFSSGSQTRTRQERVTDFHFVVSAADAVERALGSARGTGGAGPLGAVLYAAGPWELAHRGGVTRSLVLKPPSSSRPRHQRGIRLPDNDADLEASLADASQQEQQHQEPRSHRPRVKDRRRLDRETRERTGKGMPGFVHPENLKEIRHMGAETDWHERRPRLLHDYFVDLGEEHCAIPLGACAPPDVVERYHDVVKERDDRDAAVRAVLDAFCRSEKALKELTVTKEVYGWHLDGLVEGVKEIVRRSLYSGDVTVQVQVSPRTITIRPPHPAARLWSQPVYIKLMLWLLLIYPVMLIIEMLTGDRYDCVRLAYPLTRWRRLPARPEASVADAQRVAQTLVPAPPHVQDSSRQGSATQTQQPTVERMQGSDEWLYLVSMQEGAWLKLWERTIMDAVRFRRTGGIELSLIRDPDARFESTSALSRLRGYA